MEVVTIFDAFANVETALAWTLTYFVIGVCLTIPVALVAYGVAKFISKVCGND